MRADADSKEDAPEAVDDLLDSWEDVLEGSEAMDDLLKKICTSPEDALLDGSRVGVGTPQNSLDCPWDHTGQATEANDEELPPCNWEHPQLNTKSSPQPTDSGQPRSIVSREGRSKDLQQQQSFQWRDFRPGQGQGGAGGAMRADADSKGDVPEAVDDLLDSWEDALEGSEAMDDLLKKICTSPEDALLDGSRVGVGTPQNSLDCPWDHTGQATEANDEELPPCNWEHPQLNTKSSPQPTDSGQPRSIVSREGRSKDLQQQQSFQWRDFRPGQGQGGAGGAMRADADSKGDVPEAVDDLLDSWEDALEGSEAMDDLLKKICTSPEDALLDGSRVGVGTPQKSLDCPWDHTGQATEANDEELPPCNWEHPQLNTKSSPQPTDSGQPRSIVSREGRSKDLQQQQSFQWRDFRPGQGQGGGHEQGRGFRQGRGQGQQSRQGPLRGQGREKTAWILRFATGDSRCTTADSQEELATAIIAGDLVEILRSVPVVRLVCMLVGMETKCRSRTMHEFAIQLQDHRLVDKMGPDDVTMVCWAFAKSRVRNEGLMDALATQALECMSSFTAKNVGNTCWAFAIFRIHKATLMGKLASRAMDTMSHFKPQELSNLAWSFATLCIKNEPLMGTLAEQALGMLNKYNPQDMANTIWAYATLEMYHDQLAHQMAKRICQGSHTFKPQDVSNIAWAYATLHTIGSLNSRLMDSLFEDLAERAIQPDCLHAFKWQEVSNLIWSYATLEIPHSKLMAAFVDRITQRPFLSSFTPQGLANLAWGYATLRFHDEYLMESIANEVLHSRRLLVSFMAQDVSNIAWAHATLGVRNQPLMAALARHAMSEKCLSSFRAMHITLFGLLEC